VDSENVLYIVEVIRMRMDSLDIIDNILTLNKKYDFDFCVFEKGSIAHSILPLLKVRMQESNNFFSIYDLTPTQDKMTRAQSIRARMRAGAVKFKKDADWYPDLEQECMRFPRDVHDDQVDTLSLLGQALDKFVEAPTKEEEEEEEYETDFRETEAEMDSRSQVTGY
jgi:predicted phage terminase large subunit-like protein